LAEVTNELIYEVLMDIRASLDSTMGDVKEIRGITHAMRGDLIAIQTDIHGIYGALDRHDGHLDRIERLVDRQQA
jgi:hypothetical protein